MVSDAVNPSHYKGSIDCIEAMEAAFGVEAVKDFCLLNSFKYIWRTRKKNGLEDCRKADWYLNKYIELSEKDGES